LASCGNDGTLRIWALGETPKLIATKSAPHALMALAYVSDDCLFVAGFSNHLYRHFAEQTDLQVVHSCDCRDIRALVTSPDRKWIAFGGRDGVLRLRRIDSVEDAQGKADQADGIHEFAVPLHSERIRSIEFSKDGNQIVSVGEDRRIVHYDLDNRRIVLQTKIEGGKLLGLCQLEPHLFAIASSDNTIRIFNDKDQQVQAKLVGHDGSVGVLKRTQQFLISGSFDTTIRIWDIGRAVASIDSQGKYVHPVRAQFEDSGAGTDVK
jgi:WD40 repeat protein